MRNHEADPSQPPRPSPGRSFPPPCRMLSRSSPCKPQNRPTFSGETASGRVPVIFYLRTGATGPEADALLAKQRNAIQKANISGNVLAEFSEEEATGSAERPQLAKALELCREHKALLFIGTTDAMGDDSISPMFPMRWPIAKPMNGRT